MYDNVNSYEVTVEHNVVGSIVEDIQEHNQDDNGNSSNGK